MSGTRECYKALAMLQLVKKLNGITCICGNMLSKQNAVRATVLLGQNLNCQNLSARKGCARMQQIVNQNHQNQNSEVV